MRLRMVGRVAALGMALPSIGTPQDSRALPPPTAISAESFSRVTSIRELSDGRVLLVDGVENDVVLLSAQLAAPRALTRRGRGPTEALNPVRAYAGRGDTTYVFDQGNIRFLVLDGAGRVVTSWRPTSVLGGDGFDALNLARGADTLGALYFQIDVGDAGREIGEARDEHWVVVRWDPRGERVDTVTRLSGRYFGIGGPSAGMRGAARHPFAPRDVWGVAPDGTVRVARYVDYAVETISRTGERRTLDRVPFEPVRIGSAERRAEARRREAALAAGRTVVVHNTHPGGPMTEVSVTPRTSGGSGASITWWPDVAPPFRALGDVLWAAPDGATWIERIQAGGAPGTLYDVLDARARVRWRVRIADGSRLVGVTARWVYTALADDDGLEVLRRHAHPR